ncbi:hypothetical protein HK100_010765, partial [Physocladia obscura]
MVLNDSSCDIPVTGGSPKFPKLLGRFFINLPHVRFELADGLGLEVDETDLEVTGTPMNIKVCTDIQIMVSPPRPEVLLAINDTESQLSADIKTVLKDEKSRWFPVAAKWIIGGSLDCHTMRVEFVLDGISASLSAEKTSNESISIQFKDLTNGFETYGGGRVIKCKVVGNLDSCVDDFLPITLDFNRVFHLPCGIAS